MAKRYGVALPISGVVYVQVVADSEADAIDKALNGEVEGEFPDRPDEWEMHRHITRGNVCYATHWNAEITDVEDMDGEG